VEKSGIWLRHCPSDGSVLRTQETGARFEAGWDVEPPPHLSVDFRRWDPSWIPRFPFRRLPSDRAEVPIVLFEMRSLGTMQLSLLPPSDWRLWWNVPVINVRPLFSL
jgi:hypothetical protein